VLDPPNGVHLRRLHYAIVSLPEDRRPRRLDGTAYENTEAAWRALGSASVDARALGLIDASRFTDRRAGEPVFLASEDDDDEEAGIVVEGAELERPEAAFNFLYAPNDYPFPDLPRVGVTPPELAEPYALEVWAEKSTMNDVLVPLSRVHNVTLVAGVGELSLTHCWWLVQRAQAHGKPVRVLYVSDFDPAGARMPLSVARKVEHIIRRDGLDLDVRLDPLVLTREQVERYRLPRIPIKDTDLGKRHFEDRFGEGATELDALEALHPGELGRIVAGEIMRWRRPAALARIQNRRIAAEVSAELAAERGAALDEFAEELAELRQAFEAMQSAIEPRQEALEAITDEAARLSQDHVEAINAEVDDFHARASELMRRIGEALEERIPAPKTIAWASPAAPDEDDDPLFDSARGYIDQIDRYKAHAGKPTARRANGGAT
jgi:hypothetical protein